MTTDGKAVLVGNNEDYILSDARITFTPENGSKYGTLIFSFDAGSLPGFPQGGMNTAGLFYDITATPASEVVFAPGQPIYEGYLPQKMLEDCATVEEAWALLQKYAMPGIGQGHIFLTDKGGNAAIVGVAKDKQLHITRKTEKFLVLTNFNLDNPALGGYPCYRHALATELLQKNPATTVDNCRALLSAVHVEGLAATIYSNICDLNNGEMYLYYFHNFEIAVKINLAEELSKGQHSVTISSLFPYRPFSVIVTDETRKLVIPLLEQHYQQQQQK
jgi:choloylglycine hydrolase